MFTVAIVIWMVKNVSDIMDTIRRWIDTKKSEARADKRMETMLDALYDIYDEGECEPIMDNTEVAEDPFKEW